MPHQVPADVSAVTTEPATRTPTLRTPVSLTIIAGILSIVALHLGRDFFIPIAMALCFHALLRPVVRRLESWRIPAALGAAMVVLSGLVAVGIGGWALSGPAETWVARAPASIAAAQAKLKALRRPFQRLSDAATGTPAPGAGRTAPDAPVVTPPPGSSLLSLFVGKTTTLLSGLITVIVLLYLLLAAGNMFLIKLVKVLPSRGDKRKATDVLHATESIVAHYLVLTTLISAGQGVAVGLCLWLLGMSDPLIWGLMTFALEFIPYLGGAVMVGLLTLGAITVFKDFGAALLVPASYLVISGIQNNFVTPLALGGRLKLNPVALMIGVMFWWFLWGIPGAFLAIPITATLKAFSDQVPRLAPLSEFLGE